MFKTAKTGAAYTDGFAARMLGRGWDANPHNRTSGAFDPLLRAAWRDGWGDADERADAPRITRDSSLELGIREAAADAWDKHPNNPRNMPNAQLKRWSPSRPDCAAELARRQAELKATPHVGASDTCQHCRAELADFTATGGQWCSAECRDDQRLEAA